MTPCMRTPAHALMIQLKISKLFIDPRQPVQVQLDFVKLVEISMYKSEKFDIL